MDEDRFDALSRIIGTPGSRRRAVATALGGVLILLGLADPDDAPARKKCPSCKRRKHGRCKKKKPDGAVCPGGKCEGGRCVVVPPPPCQGKADGTSCGGIQQCSGGVCATPPGCRNLICLSPIQCCSGFCNPSPQDTCALSNSGQSCSVAADCSSGNCVGFRCQAA
jgi:hypothetical protein